MKTIIKLFAWFTVGAIIVIVFMSVKFMIDTRGAEKLRHISDSQPHLKNLKCKSLKDRLSLQYETNNLSGENINVVYHCNQVIDVSIVATKHNGDKVLGILSDETGWPSDILPADKCSVKYYLNMITNDVYRKVTCNS